MSFSVLLVILGALAGEQHERNPEELQLHLIHVSPPPPMTRHSPPDATSVALAIQTTAAAKDDATGNMLTSSVSDRSHAPLERRQSPRNLQIISRIASSDVSHNDSIGTVGSDAVTSQVDASAIVHNSIQNSPSEGVEVVSRRAIQTTGGSRTSSDSPGLGPGPGVGVGLCKEESHS